MEYLIVLSGLIIGLVFTLKIQAIIIVLTVIFYFKSPSRTSGNDSALISFALIAAFIGAMVVANIAYFIAHQDYSFLNNLYQQIPFSWHDIFR
jgi:hypothetical protein